MPHSHCSSTVSFIFEVMSLGCVRRRARPRPPVASWSSLGGNEMEGGGWRYHQGRGRREVGRERMRREAPLGGHKKWRSGANPTTDRPAKGQRRPPPPPSASHRRTRPGRRRGRTRVGRARAGLPYLPPAVVSSAVAAGPPTKGGTERGGGKGGLLILARSLAPECRRRQRRQRGGSGRVSHAQRGAKKRASAAEP